jgi:hypothetical protein
VNEGKVALIVNRDQVVIVLVYLDGRELSLVDNVLVAQGAEVEPVVQSDGVCRTLPQDVQLSLKLLLVKALDIRNLRGIAISICRSQHDERL